MSYGIDNMANVQKSAGRLLTETWLWKKAGVWLWVSDLPAYAKELTLYPDGRRIPVSWTKMSLGSGVQFIVLPQQKHLGGYCQSSSVDDGGHSGDVEEWPLVALGLRDLSTSSGVGDQAFHGASHSRMPVPVMAAPPRGGWPGTPGMC